MGQYWCDNCNDNHDSHSDPAVEVDGELVCDESNEAEKLIRARMDPDPICANCKHWEPGKGELVGGCEALCKSVTVEAGHPGCPYTNPIEVVELSTPPSFGCNRFESKDVTQ